MLHELSVDFDITRDYITFVRYTTVTMLRNAKYLQQKYRDIN